MGRDSDAMGGHASGSTDEEGSEDRSNLGVDGNDLTGGLTGAAGLRHAEQVDARAHDAVYDNGGYYGTGLMGDLRGYLNQQSYKASLFDELDQANQEGRLDNTAYRNPYGQSTATLDSMYNDMGVIGRAQTDLFQDNLKKKAIKAGLGLVAAPLIGPMAGMVGGLFSSPAAGALASGVATGVAAKKGKSAADAFASHAVGRSDAAPSVDSGSMEFQNSNSMGQPTDNSRQTDREKYGVDSNMTSADLFRSNIAPTVQPRSTPSAVGNIAQLPNVENYFQSKYGVNVDDYVSRYINENGEQAGQDYLAGIQMGLQRRG